MNPDALPSVDNCPDLPTTAKAVATAVCDGDHCQRQSGGEFSVNLVAHESQLANLYA